MMGEFPYFSFILRYRILYRAMSPSENQITPLSSLQFPKTVTSHMLGRKCKEWGWLGLCISWLLWLVRMPVLGPWQIHFITLMLSFKGGFIPLNGCLYMSQLRRLSCHLAFSDKRSEMLFGFIQHRRSIWKEWSEIQRMRSWRNPAVYVSLICKVERLQNRLICMAILGKFYIFKLLLYLT